VGTGAPDTYHRFSDGRTHRPSRQPCYHASAIKQPLQRQQIHSIFLVVLLAAAWALHRQMEGSLRSLTGCPLPPVLVPRCRALVAAVILLVAVPVAGAEALRAALRLPMLQPRGPLPHKLALHPAGGGRLVAGRRVLLHQHSMLQRSLTVWVGGRNARPAGWHCVSATACCVPIFYYMPACHTSSHTRAFQPAYMGWYP
jgi:hypothetical protein